MLYFYYLQVVGDICWCGYLGNVARECVFLMNECEKTTSSRGVRHSLLYASCKGVCVVKNEFVFRELVLNVFCGFGCCEFGFLDVYNCYVIKIMVY